MPAIFRVFRGGLHTKLMVLALAASAICLSTPGQARKAAEAPQNQTSPMQRMPVDARRAELRQALSSDDRKYRAAPERRRLSPEERSALNQELRAAMRGAYEKAPDRPH